MITKESLVLFAKNNSLPDFRVTQILQAIYKEGADKISNITTLPTELRETLSTQNSLFCFDPVREVRSVSGNTVKALFKMRDGALIEGVLMRFNDGRNSVCVSSQVGCGLKCAFCATGTMGLKRNLTAEEIFDQVLYFNSYLKKKASSKKENLKGTRVDHIIFMGMGEPLMNYDAVIQSIQYFNDPEYLGIAARHITVSTSGIVPGIKRLADFPLQINLAVSLHAPNQKMRQSFMPIAKGFSLDQLMESINEYIHKTHRRVSYEYVMLKDVNDSPETARELGKLIKGQRCHVNLIPYNQTYLGFSNAGKSRIDAFKEIIESLGIPTTVRVSLGQDISAACGQLAVEEK